MGRNTAPVLLLLLSCGIASARYIAPNPMPAPTTNSSLAEQHRALGLHRADIPASFDWRTVPGVVSPIRSQYLPEWCGSCWAHAVTSSRSPNDLWV